MYTTSLTALQTTHSIELTPCNLNQVNSIGLDDTNLYVQTDQDQVIVVKRSSKQTFTEQPKFSAKATPTLYLTQYYRSQSDDKLEYTFIFNEFYKLTTSMQDSIQRRFCQ